jgi:hypothetical protein
MKRPLLILLVLTIGHEAFSQSFFAIRRERNVILSAGTGTSTYFGELSNPGTLINLQPNLNVGLKTYVAPIVSVRTELNWFVLHGDDAHATTAGRRARGLSFRSNCFEINATGEISLFANGNRYYRRPPINFYGFIGVGLMYFNPVADYNGKAYSLEPLHTEGHGYSRVTPVIPVGFGARLKVGPNTNVVLEGGFRKTFTDYIDDVSDKYSTPDTNDPVRAYFQNPNNPTDYPRPNNVTASENLNKSKAGNKRGNPGSLDSYFLLNVKVEYYLPSFGVGGRRGNGLLSKKRKSNYRYNKRGGIRRRR